MILYLFSIFNNIQEIDLVKRLLLNHKGNMNVKRLIVLRLFVSVLVFGPLFLLEDVFYFTVIMGSMLSPVIGCVWPVS